MYIFLDESGNFSGNNNNYFIVGGFATDDQKKTAKSFRKFQQSKFPRKLRRKAEVKFSDSGLTDTLRLDTLSYFIKQSIDVFYTFLRTENIPPEFRKKNRIEAGLLYTEIVARSLDLLLPATDLEFRVFRDRLHLRGVSPSMFKQIIGLDILPKLPARTLLQIEAVDSTTNANIQIADWICGALYRYHNKGRNGNQFFSCLSDGIRNSQELFKDYWTNKKSP
jgi:hypothetical protein